MPNHYEEIIVTTKSNNSSVGILPFVDNCFIYDCAAYCIKNILFYAVQSNYCIKTEFSVWSGGDCIVRLYTLHCRAISLSGLRDMGVLRFVSGGSGGWL